MHDKLDFVWEAAQKFKIKAKKDEFLALIRIMHGRKVKSILEIGTGTGGSARGFLELFNRVTSVDKIKYVGVDALIKKFGWRFNFILGDSRDVEVIGEFDVLYIDGDYEYAGVRNDFERFSPLVKHGGLVIFNNIVKNDNEAIKGHEVWKLWEALKMQYMHIELVYEDPTWGGVGVLFV